jgi:hypothetical protein
MDCGGGRGPGLTPLCAGGELNHGTHELHEKFHQKKRVSFRVFCVFRGSTKSGVALRFPPQSKALCNFSPKKSSARVSLPVR